MASAPEVIPRGGGKRVTQYFGRPRLLNAVASEAVFLVLRGRVASQRVRNRLRARSGSPFVRTEHLLAALEGYLAQGITKLNLGGGRKQLDGFLNVDFQAHPGVAREIVADIRDLSFVPAGRISHVHTNHVFEHLTEPALRQLLRESARVLEPGGILTCRAPNSLGVCFGFFFGEVLEQDRAAFVAAGFPGDEDFGNPADRWYSGDLFALAHWLFGSAGAPENEHLQLLTPTKVRDLICDAGLTIVKMSAPEATNIVVVARKC